MYQNLQPPQNEKSQTLLPSKIQHLPKYIHEHQTQVTEVTKTILPYLPIPTPTHQQSKKNKKKLKGTCNRTGKDNTQSPARPTTGIKSARAFLINASGRAGALAFQWLPYITYYLAAQPKLPLMCNGNSYKLPARATTASARLRSR